ncbi:MAG: PLP-dependent aspartate aminotransferase family protein [Chloroflexi bacterium]|nr:PLP-dependent aspartate aminotransferase family protein [Chloroflexota bacterium]
MDGFSTRAIRAASRPPRVDQRPTSVPIYQAVTFSAETTDELADVTSRRLPGYSYGRIANPTADALGSALAELEGAEAAYAVASGMAAIHLALLALVRAGDRVVCTRAVYGSTRALLGGVLGRLGVTTVFVDPTNLGAVEAALTEAPTRVLYLETISNPTLVVAGDRATIEAVREAQVQTGATIAPFAAFLVLRGIATLAVRMDRHAATAAALAAWLAGEQGVARVLYPGLPSHPDHAVAARQLASGGGMLALELEGGVPAGRAFIDALRIPERTASLGSVHTIVVHPPSTTHRQLDTAQLVEGGIAPGLLRVSVGLEDLDDLQADFAAGLAAARAATQPLTAR